MKEKGTPKSFEWPRWKYSFKLLKNIPSILAIVVFFIPNLELKYRIILGIFLFVLLPVLIQTFLWITKIIVIIFKRTNYYPNLYADYQNITSKLEELKKLFFYFLINSIKDKILEIKGAKYQGGKLYIVLKNNSKLNLKEGNKIIVIDKKDSVYLGQFEITEVRNGEYLAIGVKNIDSVWHGYVKQEGETTIMPNIAAISLP
jgi:predicted DNA-binding antitoxin AbrB/MazE fold protein